MLHLWNNQIITGGKVNVLLVFIVPRPHRTSLRVDAQEIFALKKQTMLALQGKLLGSIAQALRSGKPTFWRRQWHPALVLLPEKSHGLRSLVGCGPWGHEESDMSEWLHFHFSLSCIEEGNGNPLQCSYLGNPRDGGAWWVAVYNVAQSRTKLKQLSRSSSSKPTFKFWLWC